jgi:MFS transporter, MHS family, proline/betaine transporter
MATEFEGAQPAALSNRGAVTAIIASTLGWSLDLFDLFILLYVAPAVGKAFFPSDSPTLSVAAVYASFAVTLLMRPVGSALFGNYCLQRSPSTSPILRQPSAYRPATDP